MGSTRPEAAHAVSSSAWALQGQLAPPSRCVVRKKMRYVVRCAVASQHSATSTPAPVAGAFLCTGRARIFSVAVGRLRVCVGSSTCSWIDGIHRISSPVGLFRFTPQAFSGMWRVRRLEFVQQLMPPGDFRRIAAESAITGFAPRMTGYSLIHQSDHRAGLDGLP